MWTTFVLILCQHFIFSSAAPIDLSTTPIDPVRQGTPPAGSATSAAAFLSENSSVFNSTPLLAANLQNTTAANTSKADAQTSSSLAPTSQSVFTNTSHLTSTVLPTTPLTHTSQHSPPLDGTAAPNITSNSSVTVPSYSPNMTNSSAQSDNATSTTHSLLTNSTAQPTSLHPFTNSSSTSRKSTSLPNGTVKVPTVSFPTPAASTTVLPSSSRTSASTSLSTNPTEKENKIAAPSNAGTALTVVVSLILVAVALLGLVMYLKKRRVFYSRLQEDNPTGSWSNYNNPVFEDS